MKNWKHYSQIKSKEKKAENEITVIERTALTWPEKANEITIIDQDSYNLAANTLIEIAEIEKQIKAHHTPMKTTAHKAAVAAEKKFLDPLVTAKSTIKRAISGWEIEQRKIREEAEREAREKARKEEEEIRLAKALEAEKAGKSEAEVEKIIDTPAEIKVELVKPAFEQSSRVKTREYWKAEIVDIKALCQGIADGKVDPECVLPNMPYLNAMARGSKGAMLAPGVKAVKETSIVTR